MYQISHIVVSCSIRRTRNHRHMHDRAVHPLPKRKRKREKKRKKRRKKSIPLFCMPHKFQRRGVTAAEFGSPPPLARLAMQHHPVVSPAEKKEKKHQSSVPPAAAPPAQAAYPTKSLKAQMAVLTQTNPCPVTWGKSCQRLNPGLTHCAFDVRPFR